MSCAFEEQGVYSLGFISHTQNRVLLPSEQPQQRLLAWFPKLLNICCSCWLQSMVQKLSKSFATLNVRLTAWHPEISCGTGRSIVGLMLAWDQLFHYVGRKKHSCSVAKQAIDGGNAAVAQKNVVQAEAIITPASTMNTFWLHTWLHVLCIRVTHVNYTHIFFPSVEIAKPWYWRPLDWLTDITWSIGFTGLWVWEAQDDCWAADQ